jgi:hypothetical protein
MSQCTLSVHDAQRLNYALVRAVAPLVRFAIGSRNSVGGLSEALDGLERALRVVEAARCIDASYRDELIEHIALMSEHAVAAATLLSREAEGDDADRAARLAKDFRRLAAGAGGLIEALNRLDPA